MNLSRNVLDAPPGDDQRLAKWLVMIIIVALLAGGGWLFWAREGIRREILGGRLSKASALYVVRNPRAFSLGGVRSISDPAAAILSGGGQTLSLPGLEELSDGPGHLALARRLVEQPEELNLWELRMVSDGAAEILSHKTGKIRMGKLEEFQGGPGHLALARRLCQQDVSTGFRGLKRMADPVADLLSQQQEDLYLPALKELGDGPGHLALAKKILLERDGAWSPIFSSLESFTPDVAELLSQTSGRLELGLATLSVEMARVLSQHRGYELQLNGLESLSVEVATALSRHSGQLRLGGLRELSPATAEALSLHHNWIVFDVLTELSPAAAEALSTGQNRGLIFTSIDELTEEVAIALGKGEGALLFPSLASVTSAVARGLSHRRGTLSLGFVSSLSEDEAEALDDHVGDLVLSFVTSLSDASAAALARHQGPISFGSLVEFPAGPGHLALLEKIVSPSNKGTGQFSIAGLTPRRGPARGTSLDFSGLESLPQEVAQVLSKKQLKTLNLSGLKHLSEGSAVALSHFDGTLNLRGLDSLSTAVAEALSHHVGELNLGGLSSLTDEVAEALGQHQGSLALSGVTSPSDTQVEILSEVDGGLTLGLRSLSPEAARALSKHVGRLHLSGLKSLSLAAAEALAEHDGDLFLYTLESFSDAAAKALSRHKDLRLLLFQLPESAAAILRAAGHK